MTRLQLDESDHATPGFAVATYRGQIVWRGRFADLGVARGYDTIHCHPSDGTKLRTAVRGRDIQIVSAS